MISAIDPQPAGPHLDLVKQVEKSYVFPEGVAGLHPLPAFPAEGTQAASTAVADR